MNRVKKEFRISIKVLLIIILHNVLLSTNFAQEGISTPSRHLIYSTNIDTLQSWLKEARLSGDIPQIEEYLQNIIAQGIAQKQSSTVHTHQLQLQDHYAKYPNEEKRAALLLSLGDFYLAEELPRKAIQYYDKINQENTRDGKPSMLLRMSYAYLQLERLDSALIFRNQLLKFQEERDLVSEAITTRREIVHILNKNKNYEQALIHNIKIKNIIEAQGESADLAIAHSNIGYNYNLTKDYKSALVHLQIAEKMNKKNNYIDDSDLNTNIGIVHGNLGDLGKAIDYLNKAVKKSDKNPKSLTNIYHIMSTIYYIHGDIHNALLYSTKSSELANQINDAEVLRDNYLTTANIYQDLYEFDKAFEFYQKHLEIKDSLIVEKRYQRQARIQQQNQIEKSEKEIKLLLINQEVQSLLINQLELEKEKLNLAGDKLKLESESKAAELKLLRKEQEIQDAEMANQTLVAERTKQELVLAEQRLNAQQADQKLVAARQKEQLIQAELKVNEALKQEREKEIALLTKDKELLTNRQKIDQLQLAQEANFRNTAYGVGALLGIMLLMFLGGLLNSRRINKKLGRQKNEIEKQKDQIESSKNLIELEKNKSESLLLNILPKQTAAELKAHGFSKPKHYDQVSVLFTDFSNFTNLSEGLNAEELLKQVNIHFTAFDEICEKYNIEKIKTIGDAYMCASGLPLESKSHAKDILLAAIEMQTFVKNNNAQRAKQNLKPWKMRVGIHSGPIIAGVVGSKKFSYDIWGDTVNTASRMESSGALDQINISATTYLLVKNEFKCTYRGKVKAKNKGELEMYFVEF